MEFMIGIAIIVMLAFAVGNFMLYARRADIAIGKPQSGLVGWQIKTHLNTVKGLGIKGATIMNWSVFVFGVLAFSWLVGLVYGVSLLVAGGVYRSVVANYRLENGEVVSDYVAPPQSISSHASASNVMTAVPVSGAGMAIPGVTATHEVQSTDLGAYKVEEPTLMSELQEIALGKATDKLKEKLEEALGDEDEEDDEEDDDWDDED